MTNYRIPVMRPKFPNLNDALSRLEAIRESGVFTNFGPQVRELEERFSVFLGTTPERVVSVSNATTGITAAIQTLGGAEWLSPSWTFSATVAGALAAGVSVTLGDINPDTHWLRDVKAEDRFEGRIEVAPFGSGFTQNAFKPNQRLVIDAAASIAASMPELKSLPETNMVVFSLHATKVLGIGEGGLVVCGSDEAARELRSRTNFGFAGGRDSLRLGTNSKLSEFAAAIGHVVLDQWSLEKAEWLEARQKASEIAADLGLENLFSDSDAITPYWMIDFPSSEARNKAEADLESAGIQTRRWWNVGCHEMPAYLHLSKEDMKNTNRVASTYLGIPFFRGMTASDFDTIHDELASSL